MAHESLSGGLPLGISGFRFRLTFRADGLFDFFFQFAKKALALCAVGASGLIHFVFWLGDRCDMTNVNSTLFQDWGASTGTVMGYGLRRCAMSYAPAAH